MHLTLVFLLLPLMFINHSSQIAIASFTPSVLAQGSSLFVEKNLVSPNRVFTAGFHATDQNAYCFAIWFSEPMLDGNHTLVWIANRDTPVNGKRSRLSLWKSGNLVLTDAGKSIWTTNTQSNSPLQLQLLDSGNLVLTRLENNLYIWESFSFPTDTILPNQPFAKDTVLISSISSTNLSSGFYKLYFDNDNVLRLLYRNNELNSVYWPVSWLLAWQAGRSTYNHSRSAFLDSKGHFQSTDGYTYNATDYGNALQRRLTLDVDGNLRVYSLNKRSWSVSWQAISTPCTIHGICGPNSLCTYTYKSGRTCICMHGYKLKNHSDLSLGCEPTFDLYGHYENYGFIKLPRVEFYGFESDQLQNSTFKHCKRVCLNNPNCKAFQFNFDTNLQYFRCYIKTFLFNGHYKDTPFDTYLKLLKNDVLKYNQSVVDYKSGIMYCSSTIVELQHEKNSANRSYNFMLWFSIIFGVVEAMSFVLFCYITRQPQDTLYPEIAIGFKSFGMVALEMITGRSPTYDQASDDNTRLEQKRLVSWVKEKVHGVSESFTETQIMEILNPMITGEYDKRQMNNLVKVALQCVEDDKDARPTMNEFEHFETRKHPNHPFICKSCPTPFHDPDLHPHRVDLIQSNFSIARHPMEKRTASSLFVNDGSFMERFKQLQEDKESRSEPNLSETPKPKSDISNSGSKASGFFKTNKSTSGKLAFSLKQKSKLVAPAVKLSEDEDEDERNDGNSSGDGPIKRQRLDRFDASEHSQKQVNVAVPSCPTDPTVKKAAENLASFVAKNGRQIEHITRQKNPGDTPFKFLYDESCSDYKYYEYRLAEEEKALGKSMDSQIPHAGSAKTTTTGSSQRSHQQHSNYQIPASALFDATDSEQTDQGEATAPSASDPIAMMEFYMKKAAQEEKKRRPKHSKDEMPPPASLQGDGKRGHHMGDYIPLEELDKFMASCNDAASQKAAKEAAQRARIQADNVGHRLLSKMGWKEGEGLGSSRSGIADPIMAGNVKKDNLGVGASQPGEVTPDDDIYEQYKKRMMLGYKHRPNPLGNPRKAYY
ncbi:hypothetical protein QVD17_18207 [Tagetes erecta]|uniref:G-patch domain-containing protein n=1 Tax=Tagetes erecta TaxID=13708 RepID=A0AAD8KK18_TARER|nr:hypothetical protein QVD17_18207 [Tagetes erecta]